MVNPPMMPLNQVGGRIFIPLAFHFHKCCMFYICLICTIRAGLASSFFLDYEYDCHFPFSNQSFPFGTCLLYYHIG